MKASNSISQILNVLIFINNFYLKEIMLDKKKFKANKPEMDYDDSPKTRKSKDSKYKNSKYWLSQEDDDIDDEDYDITAIFGKDEEE